MSCITNLIHTRVNLKTGSTLQGGEVDLEDRSLRLVPHQLIISEFINYKFNQYYNYDAIYKIYNKTII